MGEFAEIHDREIREEILDEICILIICRKLWDMII